MVLRGAHCTAVLSYALRHMCLQDTSGKYGPAEVSSTCRAFVLPARAASY